MWISEILYTKDNQISLWDRPNNYSVMIDFVNKGFKTVCNLYEEI